MGDGRYKLTLLTCGYDVEFCGEVLFQIVYFELGKIHLAMISYLFDLIARLFMLEEIKVSFFPVCEIKFTKKVECCFA